MAAKPNKIGAAENPAFVFKGTVKELGAASMKNVPVDDRTAVVRVDQVMEAPKNLAAFAGHDITVQLAGKKKVNAGEELMFHTEGWIFGDSVAVRSVSQEPLTMAHAAFLTRPGDPVQHFAARRLRQRFDDADVVVSGRVSEVRLPPEETSRALRAESTKVAHKPVSEHDPKWREAVVEVDDVHKGKHTKKQIVVQFPASTDVRWYKAPKFQPGQQGFFMLHKTRIVKPKLKPAAAPSKAKAAVPKEKEVETYTALNPGDFQPFSDSGAMAAMIESVPSKVTSKNRR